MTVLTLISGGPGPQRHHRQQPVIHEPFDLPIEGCVQGSGQTQRHHPHHVSGDAVNVVHDRECRAKRDPHVPAEKAGPRRFILAASPSARTPRTGTRVPRGGPAPRPPCGQLPSARLSSERTMALRVNETQAYIRRYLIMESFTGSLTVISLSRLRVQI
ncbi:jg4549 [Pararge aegeria aegeria]|uniref:Jg4549 protein n=1 Tax=Pararge aegeria aegeria TaxID=348720 RepID=A0A8S4RSM4_9NEOP|nr:jg4549 [Pararge aegeria aegeria]